MTTSVDCPSCSTTFPVDPAKVPAGGVHARCSVCASVFFVAKPAQVDDTGAEPTPDQVRAPEAAPPESEPGPADAPDDRPGEPGWESGATETEVPTWSEAHEDAGGDDWDDGGQAATVEEQAGPDADEWVIEREPDLDPASVDVRPVETVESAQEGFSGHVADDIEHTAPPAHGGVEAAADVAEPEAPAPPAEEAAPTADDGRVPEAVPAPTAPGGFQFGRRDPTEKAQRLARVLVSDMIIYNPERHARALENESLPEDFDDEIKKSWEEYVDQVGDDLARSTTYFTDALNEILAKGSSVFSGSPPTA